MDYARRALELFEGYGDAEAIVHSGRRLTYADLVAGIRETGEALRHGGVRPGAAVAVVTGNRPESVMLQFALHLMGCRSVWAAANAPAALTQQYLGLADVDAIVEDGRVRLLRDGVPSEAIEPESLFQTGGTTGRPKLVYHRHNFFQNLHVSAERQERGRLRQLAVAGFWHSSSQAAAMITLFAGGVVVQHKRFEPAEWLRTVQRERITVATLPPPMLYQVLDDKGFEQTDKSSLALLSCAGSGIAPSRLEDALDRFGPIVMPIYGMSEATLITAHPDPQPGRLASCGTPIPPSRVEIRDARGVPAAIGEVGEVWASARLMFSGYWGEPELTAQTLVDGWLNTGDLGYLDADGFLYLVDRAKDMIVTGLTSTNVYSRTVEDALLAYPEVCGAAVIGVPDERMGEAVHAVVQLAPNARVSPEELRRWAMSRLNELWAPRTVEIVDRLPLTELGKVDKKALRARHNSDSR